MPKNTVKDWEEAKRKGTLLWDFASNPDEALALMLGKTFVKVTGKKGSEEMVFETVEGELFVFRHEQDCCESVEIEDITGDLIDLIAAPLLRAEVSSSSSDTEYGSSTWTFYKFATHKGYVDVRWLGQSNGYYSEEVDVFHVLPNKEQA